MLFPMCSFEKMVVVRFAQRKSKINGGSKADKKEEIPFGIWNNNKIK